MIEAGILKFTVSDLIRSAAALYETKWWAINWPKVLSESVLFSLTPVACASSGRHLKTFKNSRTLRKTFATELFGMPQPWHMGKCLGTEAMPARVDCGQRKTSHLHPDVESPILLLTVTAVKD